MLIINTETRQYNTLHYGAVPDGWLEIPIRLEPRARAYCPYCELDVEGGHLTDIIHRPDLIPEPVPPELSEQDDIALIAIDHEYRLTLLELGVEEYAVQNP